MYKGPIFLEPVFKERIWGGTKLQAEYGYNISNELTGECWGISGHQHGPSRIRNGELEGWPLDRAWNEHRQLFGNLEGSEYPLLVKILDAQTDLSVQVHPNDEYALEKENYSFGKTECWYVISCEEGAQLVYGHHAESESEFAAMVEQGEWKKLLRQVSIQPGDFFYVPSGTIHAIGAGTMILETQQSSDITYRVYDYDRRDADGQLRDLHINQSIAVATYPHRDPVIEQTEAKVQDLTIKQLVEDTYFTVYLWKLNGTAELVQEFSFLQVSVIEGRGTLYADGKEYPFVKGDHYILPATMDEYRLEGDAEMVVSHVTI
ncbi:mannose-6-phosphate isomerase, class I [Fictibacillus iocasae]|uniref:Mannose-6-phosphate isomerase n=1 Tax=Fictibacillus iocasae TaxID=2715437 RepID=A0ABW2NQY5_9BACL